MFTSLSVSAGVQEFWQKVVVFFTVTVKDFFVNLLQNKPVAFYLIIAGAALLLAGIIALIVVGATKSKAKRIPRWLPPPDPLPRPLPLRSQLPQQFPPPHPFHVSMMKKLSATRLSPRRSTRLPRPSQKNRRRWI